MSVVVSSIVAVRRGGLGDLLVALPSVRLLRFVFPEARLTLVAHRLYGRLFPDAGVVDAVEDMDDFRWAVLSSPEMLPPPGLPKADLAFGWFHSASGEEFLKGAAVLWPGSPVYPLRANPSAGSPLSRLFFEKTAEALEFRHPSRFSFDQCARLAVPAPSGSPAGSLSRPYVVVHPGGGSPGKLWPGDRFRQVIRAAAGRGYSGAIVLGEAESPIREEWFALPLPAGWILLDRPTISALAGLLSGASRYVGNDSGVTHLAAALGIPGVAVFRSEFVAAWRPFDSVKAIAADDVRDVTVSSVLSRAELS